MNQPEVHIYPLPFETSLPSLSASHPSRLIQSPCLSFLSHTANSHWLSFTYAYISFHVILSIHLTLSSPLPMSISLFFMSPLVKSVSCILLFATLWTVAHQAPLSIGFSRQEYWSGLPLPSPGDLPNPGIEPGSPTLQADVLASEPLGKPHRCPVYKFFSTVFLGSVYVHWNIFVFLFLTHFVLYNRF